MDAEPMMPAFRALVRPIWYPHLIYHAGDYLPDQNPAEVPDWGYRLLGLSDPVGDGQSIGNSGRGDLIGFGSAANDPVQCLAQSSVQDGLA